MDLNFNLITDSLLYPEFSGALLFVKIIFIIVSLVFLSIIIILFFNTSWSKRFLFEDLTETFVARPYGAKKAFKDWLKTKSRLESKKESEYKLALIEADGLLDEILKRMGYKGENLADRLNQLDATVIPNLDQIWQAHKIRNNVVHDPDYKLAFETAKSCLEIYDKTFRDLELF